MPSSEYEWLTDREARFLDDPDQFDQQTRGEIRYRLRVKYEGTVDAMSRLHDEPEQWDKKEYERDEPVKCSNCWTKRVFPEYRYQATGQTTISASEWHHVRFVQGSGYLGICHSCWEEMRDDEMVVEQGRVPCAGIACDTHDIRTYNPMGGKPLMECLDQGNIPFSEEEFQALRKEWRDRRHLVCPDCGRPEEEIEEGEFEAIMGMSEEPQMKEGLVCGCGWQGFRPGLSLVKK